MKTHCPRNHEYTPENTYIVPKTGARHCKTCRRERMRERRPATGVGAGGHNAAKTHCPQNHEYTEENTYRNPEGRRWCRTCMRINGALQNVKRYGITPEDIQRMLEEQGNHCLICPKEFGEGSPPHVDHDHTCCAMHSSCGKCVRGLLCRDCNRGLGQFHDSPELLRAAATYLESR